MKKEIDGILKNIVHPETGSDIVASEMVGSIAVSGERIAVTLVFKKSRDPFANSIRRQVAEALEERFPGMKSRIRVDIAVKEPQKTTPEKSRSGTDGVERIIAVASGKGGVGKSTVASNLAVTLASMGYATGLLDADIYGPSQPHMFGLEGYLPVAERDNGGDMIIPPEKFGVKVMSIGFFITPEDALVWRGPMATGALRQLIHQTDWGKLDFLLIDMPPGTGDVHLTVLQEMEVAGAVIVSTPQQISVADVVRGISMFRAEKISVPVLGIIENMAWFTPNELPSNRYYIFGRAGARRLAEQTGLDFLGEIPLILSVMEGAENGVPAAEGSKETKEYYTRIAEKIVEKAG